MKLLLLLPLVLSLASCSTSGIRMTRDAQQQSLSDDILNQSIRDKIASKEQSSNNTCTSLVIRKASLISSARGVSGNLITAREHWHIEGCGRTMIYQIDYYGPISENTYTDVKLMRW